MMSYRILVMAMVMLLGVDTQKDDAVKTETNKLQGNWRIVEAERDVVKAPNDETKKITLVIKGDKLTAKKTENAGKPEEKNYEMSFTLDPSKNPKWIDVTYTGGERNGESSLGIYELKDDTLKICMSRGTSRPMEFETKAESQRHMMVLKREK